MFVSLYYYLIDINIKILSVNFFSKTTKCPFKSQIVPDDTGCQWWLFSLLLNLSSISFNVLISPVVYRMSENVADDILKYIFCPPPRDIQHFFFFLKQLESDIFHFLTFEKLLSLINQGSEQLVILVPLSTNRWVLAALAICHVWEGKRNWDNSSQVLISLRTVKTIWNMCCSGVTCEVVNIPHCSPWPYPNWSEVRACWCLFWRP